MKLKRFYAIRILAIALIMALLVTSCFLKQDRTTVVYGNITDQNGQPVDSILVSINGVQGFKYENLKQVYSDERGNYELVTEVPGKYGSANIIVPFGLFDNPKYDRSYKGKKTYRNNKFTNNCCIVTIGEKTKYDFQLIPK